VSGNHWTEVGREGWGLFFMFLLFAMNIKENNIKAPPPPPKKKQHKSE